MSPSGLGSTLIIANPAAYSGRGEAAAIYVTRFFSSFHTIAKSCSVQLTEGSGDAMMMAADAGAYNTVIALGGDGVIHEVVNGLMSIPAANRPKLGIIPMGTGNDFARTLGMKRNNPEQSLEEIMEGPARRIDVGRVNDTYFIQTLSFGLDAAIALDTISRRQERASRKGSSLYLTSGIRLFASGLRGWPYRAEIDGEVIDGIDVAFAVQNGKTYGGGFKICPDAVPNDGKLDLCFTIEKPTRLRSLALFGLARFGKHTRSSKVHVRKFTHLEIKFLGEERPPCQVDGEELVAERYTIDVMPSALEVIVPPRCKW